MDCQWRDRNLTDFVKISVQKMTESIDMRVNKASISAV